MGVESMERELWSSVETIEHDWTIFRIDAKQVEISIHTEDHEERPQRKEDQDGHGRGEHGEGIVELGGDY